MTRQNLVENTQDFKIRNDSKLGTLDMKVSNSRKSDKTADGVSRLAAGEAKQPGADPKDEG